MVKQTGTIYLKPGEKGAAGGLARQTGATINIPGTGETYTSEGGWSGGGVSGQSASDYLKNLESQRRAAAEAARIEAEKKAAAEEARRQAAEEAAQRQKEIAQRRAIDVQDENLSRYKSSQSYIAEQERTKRELEIAGGGRTISGKKKIPKGNVTIPISDGANVSSLMASPETPENPIFSFVSSKFKKAKEQIDASVKRDVQQRKIERATPFSDLNLPAKVRRVAYIGGEKLFEVSDIVRTKTIGGEPATTYEKEYGGEILGETLLFAGASPVITTTAEVTRAAQVNKVAFKGVKQTTDKGIVRTDVRFITGEGEKGTAVGLTKRVPDVSGKQVSKTVGVGVRGRTTLKIPSREPIVFTPSKEFAGVELSLSKDIKLQKEVIKNVVKEEKGFVQIGAGGVIEPKGVSLFKGGKIVGKTKSTSYVSKSFGITDKDTSRVISEVVSERGGTLGFGKIIDLDKLARQGIESVGKSVKGGVYKTSNVISKEALTSTKNIVKAASVTPPKAVVKVVPPPSIVKIGKGKQVTKKVSSEEVLKDFSKSMESQINKADVALGVSLSQGVSQKQSQRQRQKLKQEQKQKQLQKIRLRLLRKPLIKTDFVPTISLTKSIPKRLPPPLLYLPKGKLKDPMFTLKKDYGDYLFLTEGFTARAVGLKPQKIKEKDLLKAASDVSLGVKVRQAPIVVPDLKRKVRKKRKKK